ncbi:iron-siderophore ABC transporter substrate-binding protein [Nocardioides houyundeii]|uniref:iron-siderophore ABC transporter substrate-binding protein n=1 Tax=Nocardioides houyundeii TaxID=2045452 RepID=UPI000DF1FD3C|nr:iron-siderophore ABC transporter substrate-binding protein [Nocardioides houyundeii]
MRRTTITAAAAGLTLLLSACSTGSTDTAEDEAAPVEPSTSVDADAFPVTVEHAFGETEIEAEPTRVVTMGWSDHDVVLSLGVVPVGATEISWGGNDQGSTPWFDDALAELDGEQPARLSDADGAPVDEIAKLSPDLILATGSGITEAEYKKLSKVADVVAYPDAPWATSWQDSLEMVGAALGRTALADEVRADTEASIAEAAEAHPEIVGKTFVFASLTTTDMSKIDYYTPEDNRPRLLTDLGMVNAPVIEKISEKGAFYGTLSAERAADLESDVFITYAESDKDLAAFTKDPLLGQIPGLKSGHVLASTDQTDALGLSAPSPLSIPYAMEKFVPLVAEAVQGS